MELRGDLARRTTTESGSRSGIRSESRSNTRHKHYYHSFASVLLHACHLSMWYKGLVPTQVFLGSRPLARSPASESARPPVSRCWKLNVFSGRISVRELPLVVIHCLGRGAF